MKALEKSQTWHLQDLHEGRKEIGRKWVYKKKCVLYGYMEQYKVHLVKNIHSQVKGFDTRISSLQ